MESEGDEPSDSSSIIANLPPELITEIFLRLPVKSLLQYRSVSKYWLDLISSPRFIKSHLSLSTNNKKSTHHRLMVKFIEPRENRLMDCSLGSLLNDSVTETSYFNIPMKNTYKNFRIFDSVNGLICLVCLAGEEKNLFLWNPSIRKYWKLPSFETGLRYAYRYHYGFTYDEFHDDYNVLVFLFNYKHVSSNRVEVKIYSLMSNSWRSVDLSCLPSRLFFNVCGKFVNGKLHWAGLENKTMNTSWNIVSIDLADEKWGTIEKPSYQEGEGDISRLAILGSNLLVFCYDKGNYVSIWVMKEYGVKESWTKMFTINYVGNPYMCNLPCFMSNQGEFLVGFAQSFKIYNPKDDSFIYNFDSHQVYAEIYVESLVSPFPKKGRTSDATKIHAKKAQIKTIK